MNLSEPVERSAPKERPHHSQMPILALMTGGLGADPDPAGDRWESLPADLRVTVMYCQSCGEEKRQTVFGSGMGHCHRCNGREFATWRRGQEPYAGDVQGVEIGIEILREPKGGIA
jgi:hypothetical protein